MRVEIGVEEMAARLKVAKAVARGDGDRPWMRCVRLDGSGGGLVLEAQNLIMGVHIEVDGAEAHEPGHAMVDADLLSRVLREAESATMVLQAEDAHLVTRCGRCEFRLRLEDATSWPQIEAPASGAAARFSREALADLVERVPFAAAREAGRYALHGVHLAITAGGGGIRAEATDGRRMAVWAPSDEAEALGDLDVILPVPSLDLALALLDPEDDEVSLSVSDRTVWWEGEHGHATARLIDGQFPDTSEIEVASEHVLEADADELVTGFRRANILASRDKAAVEIRARGKTATIRSRAEEVGEATIKVPLEAECAGRFAINPALVLPALSAMRGRVQVRFSSPRAPVEITDRAGYRYVVMPIDTGDDEA